MPLTITSDLGVVLLAAGRQERFGDSGKPKCLSEVGDVTIYGRLKSKLYSHWEVVTVINNDQWKLEHQRMVEPVAIVPDGLAIGVSMAAGIRALIARRGDENGHALILAADTWIPASRELLIPPWIGAILDPWGWVTINRLPATEAMAGCLEQCHVGRLEYLTREGVRPWIKATGYINVNTREDLQRAKRGEN